MHGADGKGLSTFWLIVLPGGIPQTKWVGWFFQKEI